MCCILPIVRTPEPAPRLRNFSLTITIARARTYLHLTLRLIECPTQLQWSKKICGGDNNGLASFLYKHRPYISLIVLRERCHGWFCIPWRGLKELGGGKLGNIAMYQSQNISLDFRKFTCWCMIVSWYSVRLRTRKCLSGELPPSQLNFEWMETTSRKFESLGVVRQQLPPYSYAIPEPGHLQGKAR